MEPDISKHNIKTRAISNMNKSSKEDEILCNHCKRTKSNAISCRGICISDNEY